MMLVLTVERSDQRTGIQNVSHADLRGHCRRYALLTLRSFGPSMDPKCRCMTESVPDLRKRSVRACRANSPFEIPA